MNFLWRNFGQQIAGPALIAWEKVCKAKNQGGLGILYAAIHNRALMMKNIHKFLNREALPWASLIWETYYSVNLQHNKMVGFSSWMSHPKLLQAIQGLLCLQTWKCTNNSSLA